MLKNISTDTWETAKNLPASQGLAAQGSVADW